MKDELHNREFKQNDPDKAPEAPPSGEKVLLHTCCAPCASAITEFLLKNGYRPVLYYSNPNIYPVEEYEKRKAECIRFAAAMDIDFAEDKYDHEEWLTFIKGLEKEPERGARCLKCFTFRLMRTAKYASDNDISYFTTALASSRWKDLAQTDEAGAIAEKSRRGIKYWKRNWRKGGLSERKAVLNKEFGFYNQKYCGCEFSLQNRREYEKQLKNDNQEK